MSMLIGTYTCEQCGTDINWQVHRAARYRECGLYPVETYSENRTMGVEISAQNAQKTEIAVVCPYCSHRNVFVYTPDTCHNNREE